MSGSTALSLPLFPMEILHLIFYCLDVQAILRMRKVSRYMNEISYQRDIWKVAYLSAEFIRPPGPLTAQSVRDMENALVPSFRADQSLRQGVTGTAQMERPTRKLRDVRYTGKALRVALVFRQFLFIAFSEELRYYDLTLDASDSNSGSNVIYRPTLGTLQSFFPASAVDVDGRPFACIVLSEGTHGPISTLVSIFLLRVGEETEAPVTMDVIHRFEDGLFEVMAVDLGPRVIIIQGRNLDVAGDWNSLIIVVDVHTRTELVLSSYFDTPWALGVAPPPNLFSIERFTSARSVSSSTHLIVASSFCVRDEGWTTFFRAYELPSSQLPTSTHLTPSHRGIVRGINIVSIFLLHDGVLDPVTHDMLIAIRVYTYDSASPRNPLSKHGVVCLSPVPTSPGHTGIGTITFQVRGPFARLSPPFLHPSFNGSGRMFYTVKEGSYGIVSAVEFDLHAGDGEGRVIEYSSILRLAVTSMLLDYDPYAGRLCFQSPAGEASVIEIYDIAV